MIPTRGRRSAIVCDTFIGQCRSTTFFCDSSFGRNSVSILYYYCVTMTDNTFSYLTFRSHLFRLFSTPFTRATNRTVLLSGSWAHRPRIYHTIPCIVFCNRHISSPLLFTLFWLNISYYHLYRFISFSTLPRLVVCLIVSCRSTISLQTCHFVVIATPPQCV